MSHFLFILILLRNISNKIFHSRGYGISMGFEMIQILSIFKMCLLFTFFVLFPLSSGPRAIDDILSQNLN